MTEEALLQRVRAIELHTKRPSNQLFSGARLSHHKGRGMSFAEVRNYTIGDEVRFIDWNVTARFKEPFIKVFEEERDNQVFIIVDVSQSMYLDQKWIKTLETVAHLAFSAAHKKDSFGAIFISDEEEAFIPLNTGIQHVYRVLKKLIQLQPISKGTNLSVGLNGALKRLKKRGLCCVISDFTDIEQHKNLCIHLNKKHDLIALQVIDPSEIKLPHIGFIPVEHVEIEGKTKWFDLNDAFFNINYSSSFQQRQEQLNLFFNGIGVDYVPLNTEEDSTKQLTSFFKKRK